MYVIINVSGNIIGSGTALSNLNYNSITNKPDLTGYATNTNLNSISTFSELNISNLTILSNSKQGTYTPERQYPASHLDFSRTIHFYPGIHYSHIRTPNSIATRVLSWSAIMYLV